MTGFLLGLGLTITVGQFPDVLGVKGGGDGVLDQIGTLAGQLGDARRGSGAVRRHPRRRGPARRGGRAQTATSAARAAPRSLTLTRVHPRSRAAARALSAPVESANSRSRSSWNTTSRS